MGVWLGPMASKPEPIVIYAPGYSGVFTAVAFKYSDYTLLPAAVGVQPTVNYESSYAAARVSNVYDAGVAGYKNRSGILVSDAVDLSKYTTVTFDYANFVPGHPNAPCIFYVSQSSTDFDEDRDIHAYAVQDNTDPVTLDVSSLSGNYYIGVLLLAGGGYSSTTSVSIMGIAVHNGDAPNFSALPLSLA